MLRIEPAPILSHSLMKASVLDEYATAPRTNIYAAVIAYVIFLIHSMTLAYVSNMVSLYEVWRQQ